MEVSDNRRIELLMGSDLTEDEMAEVWASACPHGERKPTWYDRSDANAHREYPEGAKQIDPGAIQLWLAKLRFEAGQLTGLLDSFVICEIEGPPLPKWASEAAFLATALRFPGGSARQVGNFKQEIPHLRAHTQVKLVADLIALHRGHASYAVYLSSDDKVLLGEASYERPGFQALSSHARAKSKAAPWRTDYRFVEEIEVKAERESVSLYPDYLSLDAAYEIASLCLRGTWARGTPGTIKKNFSQHVITTTAAMAQKELRPVQLKSALYDLDAVTPQTMRAIGLTPYDELVSSILMKGVQQ